MKEEWLWNVSRTTKIRLSDVRDFGINRIDTNKFHVVAWLKGDKSDWILVDVCTTITQAVCIVDQITEGE